ncbi:MAG: SdrD B-like domain-containing protein, partial [Propionicimonas sp.]|nr:SdrD B-like domain-containing protein [Propionicimonas sp.]
GIQDDDEEVLPGVTVDLLDADGKVVATTTTDSQGRYLFDELVAGTYRIRFTLTEEQAEKYSFTGPDSGRTDADDSDAIAQSGGRVGLTAPFVLDDSNTALTTDYDREVLASEGIDPTWDAGVVLKPPVVVDPGDDTDPDSDDPDDSDDADDADDALANTGATALPALVGSALMLLAGGGALVLVARRRRATPEETD